MSGSGYQKLMEILGYSFNNPSLLLEALTHSSWSNEHPEDVSNERLEFMGDAVLGFIVASEFYQRFPDWDEGMLTAAKSHLVGRDNLYEIACRIDLFSFLRVGTGESRGDGHYPPSLGVNALEAVIGAVFLDGGIEPARKVIQPFLSLEMERMEKEGIPQDPKSQLQALSLERFGKLPVYKIEEQAGPDHEKEYLFSVTTPDGKRAVGKGSSKRAAQKDAASNLLKLLQ